MRAISATTSWHNLWVASREVHPMAQHVLVVIDHHTARIFHLDGTDAATLTVREAGVRETDDRHASDGKRVSHDAFFHDVAGELTAAKEILILGNGTAKDEFKHHLDDHHAGVAAAVVAVETIDKPSEPQLLALAKSRFKTLDTWLAQR